MRIHISRVQGLDGRDAWLVVPEANDRILRWAMENVRAPEPIRTLPVFGGWLVPLASEGALWGVLDAVGIEGVCPHCLQNDSSCEAWIQLVLGRYRANQELALAIPRWREDRWQEPSRREPRAETPKPRTKPRVDPRIDAAKVLGLTWPATKEAIAKAFRSYALKCHPDLGGSDAAMREVLAAREILTAQPA